MRNQTVEDVIQEAEDWADKLATEEQKIQFYQDFISEVEKMLLSKQKGD